MRADMKALIGTRRVLRTVQHEGRWDLADDLAYTCGVLESVNEVRTERTVDSIVGRLHRQARQLPVYGQAVTA